MTAARSAPAHDLAVTDGAGNGCGVAGTRPGAVAVVLGEQRDRPRHERAYIFHVLSGLLECGACGGGFTIIDSANYGCATHRSKGDLHERPEDPAGGVRAASAGRAQAPAARARAGRGVRACIPGGGEPPVPRSPRGRARDEGRLEAVRRKIASLIRAIEDGLHQPPMKARMAELEVEKAVLEERLATAPEPPEIRLHPNLAGACTGTRWRRWSRRWPTRR